jgi:hypothetical protein
MLEVEVGNDKLYGDEFSSLKECKTQKITST